MEEPTSTSSTPLPSPRPDPSQFPTTFVQADTTSFKQVVQMLTGTAETASAAAKAHPVPPKTSTGPKRPPFKLYERRGNSGLKNSAHHLSIVSHQQRRSELVLSPSALDFPSLVLSPVTPLVFDPEEKATAEEEEKKGFYLIPSPRSGGGAAPEPPRLLTLFPLTSPRAADNSGSSS